MNSLFKEKQKIRNPLLLILLLIGIIVPLVVIWNKIDINQSIEDNIFENFGFILFSISVFIFTALIFISKLKISINQYGILIKFYPFLKRHIVWYKIKEAKIVDGEFIGLFGINLKRNYGSAYNINAKKGLHLILKNNKELIIGTKNPKKLEKVIQTYREVYNFK